MNLVKLNKTMLSCFFCGFIVLNSQSNTIPDSVVNGSGGGWFFDGSYLAHKIVAEALEFLDYCRPSVSNIGSIVLSVNKYGPTTSSIPFSYLSVSAVDYLYNNIPISTNPSEIYLNMVLGASVLYSLIDTHHSMKWKAGFGCDVYSINDIKNRMGEIADVVLRVPPSSKSNVQWAVTKLWDSFNLFKKSNVDIVNDLSSKIAHWDISKAKESIGKRYVDAIVDWVYGVVGYDSDYRRDKLLESLNSVAEFIGSEQTIRIFMTEYLTGKMELYYSVIEMDNDIILKSTPLINIPLSYSKVVRSLSDQIAYKVDNGAKIYDPFMFFGCIAEGLKKCQIKSASDQVDFDQCNPSIFDGVVNLDDHKHVLTLSEKTLDMYGTPDNLWFFCDSYQSNGKRSPDISVNFGEGEWFILDDDYSDEPVGLAVRSNREKFLSTIVKNKALRDGGRL